MNFADYFFAREFVSDMIVAIAGFGVAIYCIGYAIYVAVHNARVDKKKKKGAK